MNGERLALPVACLLIVTSLAPAAAAQSLGEQADRAVQRTAGIAEDAATDPQAAAANATNASWQGQQANWTQTWSCQSAGAVDERAGEAAEDALDCAPGSARAGEAEAGSGEANRTTARAEEADADAERAARDALAAAEAFLAGTSEEPTQAPSHAAVFANRTLAILSDFLDGVLGLGQLPLAGAQLVASGLASGLEAALSAGQAGAQGVASAATSAAHGLQVAASSLAEGGQRSLAAIADAGKAGLETARAGVASLAGLVQDDTEAQRAEEPDDVDDLRPGAEQALDGAIELPEPP